MQPGYLPASLSFLFSVHYYISGRLSQHLLWLACLAGVAGLLASRALVALSPVVGVLAALTAPGLRDALPNYWRNGAALRAAALPGFLLLSVAYTSEWTSWRHELFRELTWLGIPLAFTLAVPLAAWQRRAVGFFFVLATTAVGLATLGQFLRNQAGAIEAIRIGQNLDAVTGAFHITFGVMLALACFFALELRHGANRSARVGWLATAAVAAVVLHVLAYRTGLLAFYTVLLLGALRLLAGRRWLAAAGLVLALLAGPVVAYYALPSVRTRVSTTVWDFRQYQLGQDLNQLSLGQRLAAIETAGTIIREHWLLGVGPADTQAAMRAQYAWKSFGLRPENRAELHNQYLQALLGGGLVGLGLWLAVLLGPLTHPQLRRNPYVVTFIVVQAVTNLVDAALELQTGLNLFVFAYGFLVVAGERHWHDPGAAHAAAPPGSLAG